MKLDIYKRLGVMEMKSGCYEFGYYGDYSLCVNNELNTYELMCYDYQKSEIKTMLITKERAERIFNNYNLSDKDLVECE